MRRAAVRAVQGLNRMNGVCVPLYDTLGDKAVEYILDHAEIRLVMTQVSLAFTFSHS